MLADKGWGPRRWQDRKDHSYFFSQSVMVSHFLRISVTGRNLEAFVC